MGGACFGGAVAVPGVVLGEARFGPKMGFKDR